MMHDHTDLTLRSFKAEARALRRARAAAGADIPHSRALEMVAQRAGYRDWNTLCAAAHRGLPALRPSVGARVSGRYLGQPFTGRIHSLTRLAEGRRHRIAIQFDAPVDVVSFDSFSSWRRRVQGVIDGSGRSLKATSNGQPHIVLERIES
ncbi:MAG: glyoxalase superfamily protein [Pseudomonadota bacterium]